MYTNITNNPTEFIRLLLDNTREIIIVLDIHFNIVIFNKKAQASILNFSGKPLIEGQSILEYASPERVELLKKMHGNVLLGASKTYKYSSALNKIYSINIVPVYDAGIIKFISVTCVDITIEEQALHQISRHQQLLQHAETIALMGSWEWDIPSDTITWSDGLYRFMGFQPGEVQPSKELGFSFVHPQDVPMAEQMLINSFETGDPFNCEIRLIRKDTDLKYIFCQGIVIRNELGRNEKFICIFKDVTKKKLLEDSIKKQDQRFKALVENSSDIIIQVNKDRKITYASPAITTLMQFTTDEVIGNRLAILAYHEDFQWLLKEYEIILQNPGVPYILQYRVNKKDGTFLWVEGTITNLLHIPGVSSVVLNQRDISQRKEAERLLEELNNTLESKATNLTSSNAELERFAYIASHDLQEPLRMVTSFLQLLKKKYEAQLDEKAQQYIYYAVDGAERMKQLIDDLLKYSRAVNERHSFTIVNMNDIVNKVLLIFKSKLEESGGKVIVGILPEILAEKTQMMQLIQNLVGNAIKYRRETPPLILINCIENDTEWIFSIEDNGMGIPAKFSEEVFNIFQRLHGKNEYEGTGIGLAVCKKITEVHGGRIWMVPAEKLGSIFSFSILKQISIAA